MLFSDHPRTHYRSAPAHEVICQLRFPTILTINNVEPADFQEAIREAFPQYARREEAAPPKVTGLGGPNPRVEQQPPVTNYTFLSADGPLEAEPHPGLHRPVHFELSRLGGVCPPSGQAPGFLYSDLSAGLLPAGGPAVC